MCYIRKLVRADIQLLCKNLSVTYRLVEHVDKIRVLKDILNFLGSKKILYVLGDSSRNSSPFSETLPDLNSIGRCLVLTEK